MAPQVALNNTKQPEIFPAVVFFVALYVCLSPSPFTPPYPFYHSFNGNVYNLSGKQTNAQFLGD